MAAAESVADPRLESIAKAESAIADKAQRRRAELEGALGRAYRSLVLGASPRDHSRAWRRGWWRRVLAIRYRELSALSEELQRVRDNAVAIEAEAGRTVHEPRSGEITWPVPGRLASRFGAYRHESGARLVRNGVIFAAEPGVMARAPASGRVRYVGPIRSLGAGILIESPAGWWVVVGGVDGTGLQTGQKVRQGTSLGPVVADEVYLEVRIGSGSGSPIDPRRFSP